MKKTIFAILFTITMLIGCASNLPVTKPGNPIVTPQQTLTGASNGANQISGDIDSIQKSIDKQVSDLGKSTSNMRLSVLSGRSATPSSLEKVLSPYWDVIYNECSNLDIVKSQLEVTNGRLVEIKSNVVLLKSQIDNAKKISDSADVQYKSNLSAEQKTIERLEGELKKAKDNSLQFLVVVCLIIVGGCVTLCIVDPALMTWGVGVGAGAASVMGISIFLDEVMWMIPWIVGAILLLGLGYLAYQLFIKNKAITEVVKTTEAAKQALGSVSETLRGAVFGVGAIVGHADTIQSNSTKSIVATLRGKDPNVITRSKN